MIICLNGLHVCLYGCAYVHMHTCVYVYIHTFSRMDEKNLRNMCPSVDDYMQMGVYIALLAYVCAHMYICEEVSMLR